MLRFAVQKIADFRSRSSSQVVDFLLRCRGLFPWSCCSADHRVSPVAPVHVVDVPVMQVVQLPRWFAVLGHAGDMPVVAGSTTGRTAPAAEPAAISFTVPLTGSTIDATAAIMTSYSSSADGPDSGPLCAADGSYDSVWDSVKPMTGKYFNYFQYQEFVGCVCMLNFWFSSIDEICPDNYNYSRFMLKDKCRSERWELYLYGDMTIKVMESRRAEHCGVLRSCSSWCDFFGPCTTPPHARQREEKTEEKKTRQDKTRQRREERGDKTEDTRPKTEDRREEDRREEDGRRKRRGQKRRGQRTEEKRSQDRRQKTEDRRQKREDERREERRREKMKETREEIRRSRDQEKMKLNCLINCPPSGN